MFRNHSLMAYSAVFLFLMPAPGLAQDKSVDNETVIESYSVEPGANRAISGQVTKLKKKRLAGCESQTEPVH